MGWNAERAFLQRLPNAADPTTDISILEIVKHFVVALMFPHMRFAGRSIDPSNSLSLDQQI